MTLLPGVSIIVYWRVARWVIHGYFSCYLLWFMSRRWYWYYYYYHYCCCYALSAPLPDIIIIIVHFRCHYCRIAVCSLLATDNLSLFIVDIFHATRGCHMPRLSLFSALLLLLLFWARRFSRRQSDTCSLSPFSDIMLGEWLSTYLRYFHMRERNALVTPRLIKELIAERRRYGYRLLAGYGDVVVATRRCYLTTLASIMSDIWGCWARASH